MTAKTYTTNKPCRHGHVGERYTSTQGCVQCAKSYRFRRRHGADFTKEFRRLGLTLHNFYVHPDDLPLMDALAVALQNERIGK